MIPYSTSTQHSYAAYLSFHGAGPSTASSAATGQVAMTHAHHASAPVPNPPFGQPLPALPRLHLTFPSSIPGGAGTVLTADFPGQCMLSQGTDMASVWHALIGPPTGQHFITMGNDTHLPRSLPDGSIQAAYQTWSPAKAPGVHASDLLVKVQVGPDNFVNSAIVTDLATSRVTHAIFSVPMFQHVPGSVAPVTVAQPATQTSGPMQMGMLSQYRLDATALPAWACGEISVPLQRAINGTLLDRPFDNPVWGAHGITGGYLLVKIRDPDPAHQPATLYFRQNQDASLHLVKLSHHVATPHGPVRKSVSEPMHRVTSTLASSSSTVPLGPLSTFSVSTDSLNVPSITDDVSASHPIGSKRSYSESGGRSTTTSEGKRVKNIQDDASLRSRTSALQISSSTSSQQYATSQPPLSRPPLSDISYEDISDLAEVFGLEEEELDLLSLPPDSDGAAWDLLIDGLGNLDKHTDEGRNDRALVIEYYRTLHDAGTDLAPNDPRLSVPLAFRAHIGQSFRAFFTSLDHGGIDRVTTYLTQSQFKKHTQGADRRRRLALFLEHAGKQMHPKPHAWEHPTIPNKTGQLAWADWVPRRAELRPEHVQMLATHARRMWLAGQTAKTISSTIGYIRAVMYHHWDYQQKQQRQGASTAPATDFMAELLTIPADELKLSHPLIKDVHVPLTTFGTSHQYALVELLRYERGSANDLSNYLQLSVAQNQTDARGAAAWAHRIESARGGERTLETFHGDMRRVLRHVERSTGGAAAIARDKALQTNARWATFVSSLKGVAGAAFARRTYHVCLRTFHGYVHVTTYVASLDLAAQADATAHFDLWMRFRLSASASQLGQGKRTPRWDPAASASTASDTEWKKEVKACVAYCRTKNWTSSDEEDNALRNRLNHFREWERNLESSGSGSAQTA
jgi:hypothetical protein